MVSWQRLSLLFVFILLLWTCVVLCNGEYRLSSVKSELKQLRFEVSELRGDLERSQLRLSQVKDLFGMDRYRFPEVIQLFDTTIPLRKHDLRERMDREFLLSVGVASRSLLWLKRANRYFPYIEKKISDKGLPEDLKYVAIVESDLHPKARSPAGAIGLWQFIPSTGSGYNLRRNSWIDERRDPVKSTEAALNYLEDLYHLFGDWILAVAAYNVGGNRIKREMKRQQVTSYFDLFLPSETERYVFRIAAAKVIFSDPEKYGFDLTPDELYEPFDVEPFAVTVSKKKMDLVTLAQAFNMTFRSFKTFNPHFLRSSIPRGRYTVYVPHDSRDRASTFFEQGKSFYVMRETERTVQMESLKSSTRSNLVRSIQR